MAGNVGARLERAESLQCRRGAGASAEMESLAWHCREALGLAFRAKSSGSQVSLAQMRELRLDFGPPPFMWSHRLLSARGHYLFRCCGSIWLVLEVLALLLLTAYVTRRMRLQPSLLGSFRSGLWARLLPGRSRTHCPDRCPHGSMETS